MAGFKVLRRDALATFWVVVAVGFYVLTLTVAVPGFASPRAVAALLLVLGSFACGAGAREDAFTDHGVTTPTVAALRVAGVAVLVVGLTALVTGSAALVAVLAGGIAVMWLAATARHVVNAPAPTDAAETAPDERRVLTPAGR